MPYISTCFRFYMQLQVENNNKAFTYRTYSHFTHHCIYYIKDIKKINKQIIICGQGLKTYIVRACACTPTPAGAAIFVQRGAQKFSKKCMPVRPCALLGAEVRRTSEHSTFL